MRLRFAEFASSELALRGFRLVQIGASRLWRFAAFASSEYVLQGFRLLRICVSRLSPLPPLRFAAFSSYEFALTVLEDSVLMVASDIPSLASVSVSRLLSDERFYFV